MDRLRQFQNALADRRVPVLLELRARPIFDHTGQPFVVAGNNALVARLKRTDGSDIALRIVAPGGNGNEWPVRYAALQGLDSTVLGRAIPAGIRVIRHGLTLEPLDTALDSARSDTAIGMEWIEGPTLIQAVDRAARAGNTAVLGALATAVVDLINTLGAASFVHGDLTATNLIVRADGRLACVDLDTATWSGSPLGPTDHGSAGYRHPGELGDAVSRDLFALLAIYASLRVLSDEPDLRRSHGDPVSAPDAVLLFSAWDLLDPSTSRCFMDVNDRVDAETREIVESLRSACVSPVDELPRHVVGVPRLKLPPSMDPVSPSTASIWNLDNAVDRIKARYSSSPATSQEHPEPASADVNEAQVNQSLPGWSGNGAWSTWTTAPDLEGTPPRDDATDEDRSRLLTALDRNNEPEIARLWARLHDDPISAIHGHRVEAALIAGYQRRVTEASSKGRDRDVVGIAQEAESRGLPLGTECRLLVRAARERLAVRATLEDALQRNDGPQLAELAVSGRLVVLGDTDRQTLQCVLRAIEWPALQRAIQSDDDSLITEAFDAELFDERSGLDQATRDRIRLAERRVDWLRQVRTALRKRQVQDLNHLFLEPPEGGTERLSAPERRRIRQSIERRVALEDLGAVIRSDDDAAIISALNRVERVGARISDRFTWGVIQRVVERVSVVEDLIEAAEATPIDYGRLAQLLPVVRALGLAHDPRLHGDRAIERLDAHVVRIAHVRRIRAAITRDNDIAIMVAAVPDPHGALEALTEEERDRVAQAILSRRRVDRTSVDARISR